MKSEKNENQQPEEKKPWIKPSITPLRSGLLNKSGISRHPIWMDQIDGVPVKQLLDHYGSPLYVVSEHKLRQNIHRIKNAFTTRYPKVLFGWSYKTNYLGAVCNLFHQEGSLAEVVSTFEYEKARSLGVPGHCIIFNGPNKSREILERAIDEGAHIHIDHLDELYLLEEITESLDKDLDVSIRLNFDNGYTEQWSRFGFNIESGQALDAVWRIHSSKHLSLTGLHSHIGTFITEPLAYKSQIKIMCDFMNDIETKTGSNIQYLDIGGGFASMNSLQGIYLPPEQVVPSIEQYAEIICDTLTELTHERQNRGVERPILILETGRAIIDDAEVLISTVIANKHLPDGRRATILDAGVNHLFTAFWYNHDVTPAQYIAGRPEETVLYGPLCMNIDVMRSSVMLPPLSVGHTLIFSPVGAYNNTQWLQFIEYRPNVVMIQENSETTIIRTAENLESMTRHEKIPAALKQPYPSGAPENF